MAFQEVKPSTACGDLLTLLVGDILLAERLELFQIFKDEFGHILKESPVLCLAASRAESSGHGHSWSPVPKLW